TDPRGRVRVTAVLVRVGKGVVGIEHSYAIHKDTDLAQRIEATFGLRHRVAREPKNETLISRQIGKRKATLRIQIPGTHDMAAETRAENIHPFFRTEDLLNSRVN